MLTSAFAIGTTVGASTTASERIDARIPPETGLLSWGGDRLNRRLRRPGEPRGDFLDLFPDPWKNWLLDAVPKTTWSFL
ncbi:hypothetical protein [Streptomyces sp. NPDC048106]|uniref:hypothetical protein n=1 Tax=Streptomyces sp. NPDC048106 TaxID=3155750 RepID=UPI0034512EB0